MRGALPLLVIIYSYNFVQRFAPIPPLFPSPTDKETGVGTRRRLEKDRERERESARACCSTRVCQCLPVSTPTYLCKSFNLTPPYRARIPREIVSRNLFVFIAPTVGKRRAAFDPQQPYDRVSLVPTLPPTRVYIDVKSCATRTLRASLQPKNYLRKSMLPPIQPRDCSIRITHADLRHD